MAEIAKDHSVLKGGEQHAVWTGAGWMGLCALLRLPLRWVPIPGVALGGVAAEAAGDEDGPDMGGATPYDWPWAPMPKEQEVALLEDEARWLERDMDSIRKRLEELRK